jgi:hypothetical protein
MNLFRMRRRSVLAAPVLAAAATLVAKPAMAQTGTEPTAPECAADLMRRS